MWLGGSRRCSSWRGNLRDHATDNSRLSNRHTLAHTIFRRSKSSRNRLFASTVLDTKQRLPLVTSCATPPVTPHHPRLSSRVSLDSRARAWYGETSVARGLHEGPVTICPHTGSREEVSLEGCYDAVILCYVGAFCVPLYDASMYAIVCGPSHTAPLRLSHLS